MKLHPDYGGTPEQFQSLQSSYKDVLRRYNFDSVLPRLDARQAPKTQGKTPGQPCGNGWISAGFKCDPEKAKTAGARLRNPENSAVKSRFVDRMRKAKGLGAGPRDKQMSDRVAKRIAEKTKEAIAQPTKSKTAEPKARHRTMAKSVTSIEGLTSRMKAFENMAKSPSLNEKGRENASQIVQAFKEEIATREIKPLKLVRGVAATQSAIKTKNPKTAQKAAELLREGVGLPKTPQKSSLIKRADKKIFVVGDADIKTMLKTPKKVSFPNGAIATAVPESSVVYGTYGVKEYMFRLGDQKRMLPAYGLSKFLEQDNTAKVEMYTTDDLREPDGYGRIAAYAGGKGLNAEIPDGTVKMGDRTLFRSNGQNYSIDSRDRADTKSGKTGKKCKGGWTSSDNDCADDKPGPMEKAFKKEAAKRKKSPTSAKTIDTGAKSRIAGLIKKLEQSNKAERESLSEHLRSLPTESKPVIKGGSPQSRIKRLLSSLENLDKPLDQDFGKELRKRGKK
jgi:hypothetical protein